MRFRQRQGFTLIELLVALFITAVMFAIGYGSLQQALRSREQLDAQSKRLAAVQLALHTLEQDFELLQPRPVRDLLGDRYLPALTTSPLQMGILGGGAGGANAGNAIPIVSLTRAGWTNPVGLQRSELQRVTYVLDGTSLVREYWPVLDATEADTPLKRPLLEHVRSISLRFMDAGHAWRNDWPAPTPGGAQAQPGAAPALALDPAMRARPVAVMITLELDDLGLVVRVVEVPA